MSYVLQLLYPLGSLFFWRGAGYTDCEFRQGVKLKVPTICVSKMDLLGIRQFFNGEYRHTNCPKR